MAFIPHRPTSDFTLTNATAGQSITATQFNGVNEAMTYMAQRGHLHVNISGTQVNEQQFQPPLGVTWPGVFGGSSFNNSFRLGRKALSVPFRMSPADTHYTLFFNYRLNPYTTFTDTDGVLATIGPDIFVNMTKAGQNYELAHVSFINQPFVPYYNETLVDAPIPMQLITDPVGVDTCYITVYLDFTSKYKRTPNNAAWYYAGPDDNYYNGLILPWPDLPTFWNGLGALSFSTYKSCEDC